MSSRKGENFPFWTKTVRTKIKPDIRIPAINDLFPAFKLGLFGRELRSSRSLGHQLVLTQGVDL